MVSTKVIHLKLHGSNRSRAAKVRMLLKPVVLNKKCPTHFLNLTFNNIHKLFQYSELSLSQQIHKLLILLLKK
jgi:hypothetical protein